MDFGNDGLQRFAEAFYIFSNNSYYTSASSLNQSKHAPLLNGTVLFNAL